MAEIDLKEIAETINATADWPETMDLVKAKAFASAVRRFIMFTPSQSAQPGGFSTSFNLAVIENQLNQAMEFIQQQDPASVSIIGVRHGFR